jgi:hypothetical protein
MRTMMNLVSEILTMSKTDLAMLAEGLATFDNRKADQFKTFIEIYVRDEETRREKEIV